METFLSQIGLEQYIDVFKRENIDMNSIKHLGEEHLKELGMTLGHRLHFRAAIAELIKSEGGGSSPRSSPRCSNIEEIVEYTCKVIVVGDLSTGKTSLIERYTHGTFEKGYKATIGVDFCLKDLQWNDTTTVNLQLWDIAGQERYTNLTRMYYKEARGAFVVFDVSRDKSLHEGALKWKADIDNKVLLPNGEPIPVVLLANKCDLIPSDELPYDLDKFCKQHGFAAWFLTSAKEGIQIENAANFLVELILRLDPDFLKINSNPRRGITLEKPQSQTSSTCCS